MQYDLATELGDVLMYRAVKSGLSLTGRTEMKYNSGTNINGHRTQHMDATVNSEVSAVAVESVSGLRVQYVRHAGDE